MPSTRPSRTKAGRKRRDGRRLLVATLATAFLILVWQLAAARVGKDIVLPSPLLVAREFLALATGPTFLAALSATFGRGLAAFGLSCAAGVLVGFLAGRYSLVESAFAPLLTTIRATPVLALILLALLWFPSGVVPIFAAFLMAFPVMVTSSMQGIRASSPELLEMALLYKVPRSRVLLELRVPSALPQVLAGARSALGLCWKVVVAGEVLSQPARAIGSGMQSSRILLETPRVFAWALAAILLCGLTEWIFSRLIGKGPAGGV